jgi:hypothetical protein
MQIERAVRLMAVQEYGHGGNGDVRQHQGDRNMPPPGQIEQAGKKRGFHLISLGSPRT